jgi:hypothetical protein
MNERIRQLAEQAGYLPDNFGVGHWDMPECKRFAELIVLECAVIVSSMEEPHQDIAELVKQHFGVE